MAIGLVYLRIVLSRWRLVLALIALGTLGAWAVSVFYLATKPKFEAAARLNIVPTAEELGYASRFVRGSTFDGGSVLLGTYAEYAHTRPVVAPIVDRYIAEAAAAQGISPRAWLAANTGAPGFSPGRVLAILNYGEAPVVPLRDEMIEELTENTKIETVEGTYLLRLAVEWEDAKSAAWFANALADAIIARAEVASRSTGREIAGTLEQRLAAKRAELAAVLRQSRGLKSSIGVVDLDRQKTALLEARLTEQAQLTTDRAALDSAKSQVAALRSQSSGKLTGAQNTVDQTLAIEAPRAAGLERSVAIRAARIGQIDRQIAGLGGSEDRVKTLDDRAALLQQEVNALTERVSFSQTENLANAPRIQLIERATPPLTRSSPKIFFNTILGFIGGCALAACALLLLGPAKPKARAEDDLRDAPEPAVTVDTPHAAPSPAPGQDQAQPHDIASPATPAPPPETEAPVTETAPIASPVEARPIAAVHTIRRESPRPIVETPALRRPREACNVALRYEELARAGNAALARDVAPPHADIGTWPITVAARPEAASFAPSDPIDEPELIPQSDSTDEPASAATDTADLPAEPEPATQDASAVSAASETSPIAAPVDASPTVEAHVTPASEPVAAEPFAAVATAAPVPDEPEPAVAPVIDRRFPGTLPRPVDGTAYAADEIARIHPRLGVWMFEQLAPDDRGLFVGSIGHEEDARQLAQFLHAALGRDDVALAVVDGRQPGCRWDRPGKPFVYLGKLDAGTVADTLARMPADAHLVLATRAGDPQDWRESLGLRVPHPAHVIPLDR
ncbi:hypothetical protein [Sphingomonas sp. NBWT7]|uniref:hypothetical protein n=1 Tax=Sphingomonas sp. NBWT7 TaxID=2596913 RepID=UPI0016278D6E|nr:hypothetical protein [Sphingomonas sp. NBWT7]